MESSSLRVQQERWMPVTKEGWQMPIRNKRFHYFVEGKSLCGRRTLSSYNNTLSQDTGNEEPLKDDCKSCFRKLVKRRARSAAVKVIE